MVCRQVEYYFSDENLPTDPFLLAEVGKDAEGYGALRVGAVGVSTAAAFPWV